MYWKGTVLYWSLPSYNILKIAGSSYGYKHTEEVIAKISAALKKIDRSGKNNPRYGLARPEGGGKSMQKLEVLDISTNSKTEYDSMSAAALALNIKQNVIFWFFTKNKKKPYKGRYIFKKID